MKARRELIEQVCNANLELVRRGLVIYSWGNVSGIDRDAGIVVIKPSGIDYSTMKPEDMVEVRLADGEVLSDNGKPSSDTDTHLVLYRAFPDIGGVAHTHSTHATMWAQACCELPCYGTTHADTFYGTIPITRRMKKHEIQDNYEAETGKVIVEAFRSIPPMDIPAALVAGHGPFTWGANADKAVEHSVILEEIARIAIGTRRINFMAEPIQHTLLDRHYFRKHGPNAYYGQTPD